jgi:hypothetical protein
MSSMFGPNKYTPESEDTGWVDVALTDTTNFDEAGSTTGLKVRRVGNVVTFMGTLKMLTATYVDSFTPRTFATLTTEFRPTAEPNVPLYVQQGDGLNRWTLRINGADGNCQASKFAPGPSAINSTLAIYVVWTTD